MTSRMPSFSELPVADIVVGADRLRVVSEAKVTALMDVISAHGFIGRITVRRTGKSNHLIDGAHRLEAATRLGMAMIPADVLECSQSEAQQLEATGNLLAGMTPLQDAIFLAAWQDQQEKLHPELRRGVAGAMAKNGLQTSFKTVADVVAEARQIKPRQVQKIIQAARRLSVAERTALQSVECSLPLDGLIGIGKLTDPEERQAVVRKLSLGAAKSVSQARRAWATEAGSAVQAPDASPSDRAFNDLLKAWQRAPMKAKKRFLHEQARAIWVCRNAGAPLHLWQEATEMDPAQWAKLTLEAGDAEGSE